MNGDVCLPYIPIEVWVEIFKKLDGPSLWSCQHVCSTWKTEIMNMALSNKLNGRGLDCRRLLHAGDALEHKRSIRNSISVECSQDTLLVGVYSYTVNDKEILDDSVVGTFDRITTTLSIWQDNELLAQKAKITTSKDGKAAVLKPGHVPNMRFVALDQPIVLNRNETYDVELNLLPTDVTNHYSGWPITRTGADVWTCWGKSSKSVVSVGGVDLRFSSSSRGGRDCLKEGQIPRLVIWPLQENMWSPLDISQEEELGIKAAIPHEICLDLDSMSRITLQDGMSLTLNVCQIPHVDAIAQHFCTRGIHKKMD